MNKKGFTMVELLVVISLIALLSILIAINMSGILSEQKGLSFNTIKNQIESAACAYIDRQNNLELREEYKNNINGGIVLLKDIINQGLIDGDVVDPRNNNTLESEENTILVKIQWINKEKKCTLYFDSELDLPVWKIDSTSPAKGRVTETDKVIINFSGTDDNSLIDSLTTNDITIKIGENVVNPSTKNLVKKSSSDQEVKYELTLSGLKGQGNLSLEIAAKTLIDKFNNYNVEATLKTDIDVFINDTERPVWNLVSTSPNNGFITSNGTASLVISGSDENKITSNLKKENIKVKVNNLDVTATISVVKKDTNQYALTLNKIGSNGRLSIVIDANTLVDEVGNQNIATTLNTSIIIDNKQPVWSLVSATPNNGFVSANGVASLVISGSDENETTSSLNADNIIVKVNGIVSSQVKKELVLNSNSTNKKQYTLNLRNIASNGNLLIEIAAKTQKDKAGNESTATTLNTNITIDNIKPIWSLASVTPSGGYISSNGKATIIINSRDSNNTTSSLNANNITVKVGGLIASASKELKLTTNSATQKQYTLTLTGITGNGNLSIEIAANTVIDSAGNGNVATPFGTNITLDNVLPSISISDTTIDFNTEGNIYSASFGNAGGTVNCVNTSNNNAPVSSYRSIGVMGSSVITCTATPNNGLSSVSATGTITLNQSYSACDNCGLNVTNGAYHSGNSILIPRGGTQFGPYVKMLPGCYQVLYYGNNSNIGVEGYTFTYNSGRNFLNVINLNYLPTDANYFIQVPSVIENAEAVRQNNTDYLITVDRVDIAYRGPVCG